MAASTLEMEFGELAHGWLPISVKIGGQNYCIDASHTPIDPIQNVLNLANFLLEPRSGLITLQFSLEPDFCTIHAEKCDVGDSVSVTLQDHEHQLKSELLSCEATATQIWRALTRLAPVATVAHEANDWLWQFPHLDMQRLATAVDFAKRRDT